jgi:biopolymer transport protein ExbD
MKRAQLLIAGSLMAAVALAQPSPLRKGVSVQMASSTNSVAVPDADLPDSLIVAVTMRGRVYLEVTEVTPEELAAKLKPEVAAKPGRKVYLKSDARTSFSTVAEVLNALRSAGVATPVFLADKKGPVEPGNYRLPYGLEVWLGEPAGTADSRIVRIGMVEISDDQLKAQAQREKTIVLRIEGPEEWGDVVHAADVCRGAGAKVYLSTSGKQ